jgi:membrane protease YdiL (CAAX protease family)
MNEQIETTLIQTQPQSIPHTLKKTKLLWLILFITLGFASYFAVGYLLDLIFDLENQSYEVLILISTAANFFVFTGFFFLFSFLPKKVSLNSVGLINFKPKWEWLLLIPAIVIALMPLRSIVGVVVELAIHGDFSGLEMRSAILMPENISVLSFLLAFLGIGILAPIGEEMFFRGFIHTNLIDHFSFGWRVVISSFIFSLGHYDSIGVIATSFVMGIALAIAYEKTHSLWFSIGMHIVNNTISVLLLYAMALIQNIYGIELLSFIPLP